jgi:hypothetical protein
VEVDVEWEMRSLGFMVTQSVSGLLTRWNTVALTAAGFVAGEEIVPHGPKQVLEHKPEYERAQKIPGSAGLLEFRPWFLSGFSTLGSE